MTYATQSKDNSNPQHQSQTTKATTPTFSDNRESTFASLPLQAMMASSPQQQKLKSSAQLMANSAGQQKLNVSQNVVNKPEPVQRMKDEELLQGKFEAESVQRKVDASRPNNTGLPDNLKSGIENLSGMSMDHVKVHYNSDKPAQLQAHAYAQGNEIHVAPGQEQHLPHEAWHVVQQMQGRVKPTVQMKGDVLVNDDVGLEREVGVMDTQQFGTRSDYRDVSDFERASENELAEIARHPEVKVEIAKLIGEQKVPVSGEIPEGISQAQNNHEHIPVEIPPPTEEAAMHGKSLEEALEEGVVQRYAIGATVQCFRPLRAAAIAARYLISSMATPGSGHGFMPVRRNHQYVQKAINGANYQYTTSGQGCIDFSNNQVVGGNNPVTESYNIGGYFSAHGWDLRNLTRYYHFKAANSKRAGYADTSNQMPPDGGNSPADLTWHHDEPVAKMDLVERDVHSGFAHRGGFSIWGS